VETTSTTVYHVRSLECYPSSGANSRDWADLQNKTPGGSLSLWQRELWPVIWWGGWDYAPEAKVGRLFRAPTL